MNQLKLDNQLCFALYIASKEMVRKYQPILDEVELTYTQYLTMLAIWENNEINVKTLGEKLYLDSGTLTPILKKLELKEYIIRERSKEDERNLIVSITKKGLQLKEMVKNVPFQVADCVQLDANDAKHLYELLWKLNNILTKED